MKKNLVIILSLVFLLLLFFLSKPLINFVASPQTVPQKPVGKELKVGSSSEAIQLIQANFAEVSQIKPNLTPKPFDPDRIVVLERGNRWDIVFQTGSGDCPAGCLNNYFWYFSVWQDGRVKKMGQFSRVFVSSLNSMQEKGSPLWGIPR